MKAMEGQMDFKTGKLMTLIHKAASGLAGSLPARVALVSVITRWKMRLNYGR